MKQYAYKKIETGWDDPEFENKINQMSNEMSEKGWEYYDIKITSNGNNCLMIFARDN